MNTRTSHPSSKSLFTGLCKYICNRVNPLILLIGVLTIFTACGEKGGNTLKDPRDGKKYRTVKIGEQVWMAENLNYEAKGSLCYDIRYKPENCAKYGRLYDWKTAKSACPSGWHLPSKEEWQVLVYVAGGDKEAGKNLKAANGWNDYEGKSGNGEDKFGFSALPGGYGDFDGGFTDECYVSHWWSASEHDSGSAYSWKMNWTASAYWNYDGKNDSFQSVRCVKD